MVFGVYLNSVTLDGPLVQTVLYLHDPSSEANPKAISERTSYLQVRLEFHRYPQLIPAFFNIHGFGPSSVFHHTFNLVMGRSLGFGSTSAYSFALFRLAFATAPTFHLNLASKRNSPVHSTKGTPLPINGL